MILSTLAVLITFGMVIFVHELGHFIMCRVFGIKVEVFAFGFGKPIKSWTRGETKYAIGWIPLGGYVKPAGDNLQEAKGNNWEYFGKPWYQRIGVALAGPVMNYALAFVLFLAVILAVGVPKYSAYPVIGEMIANYPAHTAGLKQGDKIISVNGEKVESWEKLVGAINAAAATAAKIEYERNGVKTATEITVKKEGGRGIIGIYPDTVFEKVNPVKAAGLAIGQCWYWTEYTVTSLANSIKKRQKPDISGPIGIVHIIGKAAHKGWANFVFLVGLISIAIGFFNLLPIPILDGGHIIMYLGEGISRKKLTEKVMGYANSVGICFLLFVLVFATYNDIKRIFIKSKPPVEQTQTNENK